MTDNAQIAQQRKILTTSKSMFWRIFKDKLVRGLVTVGGNSVILTIVLIFFYLLYVVVPIFSSAQVHKIAQYSLPNTSAADTLYLAIEEQNEIAVTIRANGEIVFFSTRDGHVLLHQSLAIAKGVRITSFAESDPVQATVAFGLSNGQVLLVKHKYRISFTGDQRVITPYLEYPLGSEPLSIAEVSSAIEHIAIQINDETATLATASNKTNLHLTHFAKQESFLGDDAAYEKQTVTIASHIQSINKLLIDSDSQEFYVVSNTGELEYYDISSIDTVTLQQTIQLTDASKSLTDIRFLAGGISLLTAYSDGTVTQWFAVRAKLEAERNATQNRPQLTAIRSFRLATQAISVIAAEHNRKGFLAADSNGNVGIYHSTAHRTLLTQQFTQQAIKHMVLSPRANGVLVEDSNGELSFWEIENEHPEISWFSIWGNVWYESYDEAAYIWQSSSASNDFEPKFSLIPISFGTIKAAFYAMIMAIPLAIMGAVFTAYFMTPRMRRYVKPSIEIMEALPTVILGFLAGLWFAPFIENHLPGFFTLIIVMPLAVLMTAYLWSRLPENLRQRIPGGWEAAILIPVIVIVCYVVFALSPVMEVVFFNGDMRDWLDNEMGLDFDQRNSIVVGVAMGFAVIPTIFSMAEDAIFAVPRHLTHGSLALGATAWQTLVKVVILTASPGIFSAIMIGFGRAVGETMIVLMATGNTPIMDFSLFQGMRTLSANIAVEMPESEVASTHYRILFLAALILFVFTFFFNTFAELVRFRLRQRYSNL